MCGRNSLRTKIEIDVKKIGLSPKTCWVFGLCPSSGILETRKHNVSETGTVSVLR
jgi:hypothetical protein